MKKLIAKLTHKLLTSPTGAKWVFNCWPPFLGTGFRVESISSDFRDVHLRLNLRFYTKNYIGTQFGGSLFAMTDPFYTFMLLNQLGPDYFVCDQAAEIYFASLGKGHVTAHLHLSHESIKEIRKATENGEKNLPQFVIDIIDEKSKVLVAQVKRTLYVRKKKS